MSELKFIETTDETIYTDILEELENGVGEPLYLSLIHIWRRRILRRSALLRAKPQQHHGRSTGRSLQELRG